MRPGPAGELFLVFFFACVFDIFWGGIFLCSGNYLSCFFDVFSLKIAPKGGPGATTAIFFAEVQQTMCFASPNGSPHNPESTKIGQGGQKFDPKPPRNTKN